MPRPQHKNEAIIGLSSHPSRQSLCFDSKLVVVVVVIRDRKQTDAAAERRRSHSNFHLIKSD